MYELIYTSTPLGLITGRSGFTTVALTEGFPPNLITPIENLSGYKPVFISGEENENRNPVNFSCQQFRLGRTSYIVLSKISYAGLSYTGRSNVLAHHLLFRQDELDQIPGGAISVLRAGENFPSWSGEPRMLAPKKNIAFRPLPAGGEVSQKLAGDARWGSCIAESFRANPDRGFSLAFDPLKYDAAEILDLIAEVAAHLTGEEIRKFTFSTYSYLSGAGNPIFIRSYVNGSAQLSSIRRLDPGYVIDLGSNNPLPQSWLDMQNAVPPASSEKTIGEVVSTPLTATDTVSIPVSVESVPQTVTQASPAAVSAYRLPDADPVPGSAESIDDRSEQGEGKKKWIIFPVIFILIFVCLAVFSSVLFNKPEREKAVQDNTVSVVEKSENPEEKMSGHEAESTVVSNVKSTEVPAALPEKSADPVSEVSKKEPERSVTKPAEIFGKPSQKDICKLYLSIFRGKDYKLPASLRNASALEIIIKSVGGMSELSELSELQNFIKDNNSKSVVVYGRKFVSSGLTNEWVPDTAQNKKMTLRLSPDGRLRIRQPDPQISGVPSTADIAQISFVSEDGEKVTFDLAKLPGFIDRMLNSSLKVSLEFEDASIKFMLYVPDDLWTFRSFYNIDINGRNLGGINSRKIILHELDLHVLLQTLEKRNMMLRKLREAEKLCREFKDKHGSELKKPELAVPVALEDKMADELRKSAFNDNDEKWKIQKDAVDEKLQSEVNNENISKKDAMDFLKKLDEFRKRALDYRTLTKEYQHLRNNVEECRLKYAQTHAALKNDLNNISPALYKVNRKVLEATGAPVELKSDFYRKTKPDKLTEDIKIKIIQKVR